MISKIFLKNFKCHENLSIDIDDLLFFILGKNGSGKTSILESILMLNCSKTIMNSDNLLSVIKNGKNGCFLSFVINNIFKVDIDIEKNNDSYKKVIYINEKKSDHKNISEILEIFTFSQFFYHEFITSKTARRKMIDKICDFFFREHNNDLLKCEKLLSQRIDILRNENSSKILDEIEIEIAKIYQIILLRRLKILSKINSEISEYSFINGVKTECSIDGNFVKNTGSLKEMVMSLYEARMVDRVTKRNSSGINKDDFLILYDDVNFKNLSMGEQKIALLKVFLSFISLSSKKKFSIVLLDELFSLLDEENSNLVMKEFEKIKNTQIFITDSRNLLDKDTIKNGIFL